MSRLSRAIILAVEAHGEQVDKAGVLFVLHPLRVMDRMRTITPPPGVTNEDLMIAGVLHDTVEDTPLTLARIQEEFGEIVTGIVDGVTRREDEVYQDGFIVRCAENPGAVLVKLADIDDNLSRLDHLPESEQGISKRYHRASAYLIARI
jgi:(p)ppGpp synthase/HD superfamily hydrolase